VEDQGLQFLSDALNINTTLRGIAYVGCCVLPGRVAASSRAGGGVDASLYDNKFKPSLARKLFRAVTRRNRQCSFEVQSPFTA
jgi:hypothetical protein